MSISLRKSLLPVAIIICFLSFSDCTNNPTAPTTGTIQGRVMNAVGDTLIVSASVSTTPPTNAVSTDAKGEYIINTISQVNTRSLHPRPVTILAVRQSRWR